MAAQTSEIRYLTPHAVDKKKKKYVRKSVPGHTGCVIAVNTKKHLMQVEEGNNKNAVRTRTIDYRSLDIMGFCIPYYK